MSEKKKSYPPVFLGLSFMLSIFFILTMVIFAVLSLSSAQKDALESQKNAQRTRQYYEACNQSEVLLSQLNAKLLQAAQEKKGDFYEELQRDPFLSYTVPIDEENQLEVRLQVDLSSPRRYQLLTLRQCPVSSWEGSDNLPVLGHLDTE